MSNIIVLPRDQEMIGKWVLFSGRKNEENKVFYTPMIVLK